MVAFNHRGRAATIMNTNLDNKIIEELISLAKKLYVPINYDYAKVDKTRFPDCGETSIQ